MRTHYTHIHEVPTSRLFQVKLLRWGGEVSAGEASVALALTPGSLFSPVPRDTGADQGQVSGPCGPQLGGQAVSPTPDRAASAALPLLPAPGAGPGWLLAMQASLVPSRLGCRMWGRGVALFTLYTHGGLGVPIC